jgi:hypothetical protein
MVAPPPARDWPSSQTALTCGLSAVRWAVRDAFDMRPQDRVELGRRHGSEGAPTGLAVLNEAMERRRQIAADVRSTPGSRELLRARLATVEGRRDPAVNALLRTVNSHIQENTSV